METPKRIELTFTESAHKGEKPIARYHGKVCFIPGLQTALPGEVWECEVLEDNEHSMKVMPVELLQTAGATRHEMNIKLGKLIAKLQCP